MIFFPPAYRPFVFVACLAPSSFYARSLWLRMLSCCRWPDLRNFLDASAAGLRDGKRDEATRYVHAAGDVLTTTTTTETWAAGVDALEYLARCVVYADSQLDERIRVAVYAFWQSMLARENTDFDAACFLRMLRAVVEMRACLPFRDMMRCARVRLHDYAESLCNAVAATTTTTTTTTTATLTTLLARYTTDDCLDIVQQHENTSDTDNEELKTQKRQKIHKP